MSSSNGTVTLPTPQDIDTVAEAIWLFVHEQGQVTREEVRTYCKTLTVPTDIYQKAWARLLNQMKVITEVTNEEGVKVFRFKDAVRTVQSYRDFVAILGTTKEPAQQRERYTDWYTLSGHFRLISASLGGKPIMGEPGRTTFLYDPEGQVYLPARQYQAMMFEALLTPMGRDLEWGSARYQVWWDYQTLPAALVQKLVKPVPPARPGMAGQGLTECEMLPPGTAIPWQATIPGSHIPPAQFASMLELAGRYCGLSSASHNQGFGRFRPTIERLPHAEPPTENAVV